MFISAQDFEQQMPDGSQLLSNEPEMETSLHYTQLLILVTCLEFLWQDREDFFIGANLTIYFSRQQLKHRDFRGPDFFLVRQTEKRPRKSWVVWEEDGRYPNLIIELLSDSTADVDRNLKKQLYQDRFRTPEYFWFSPETLEFQGYRWQSGGYIEIPMTERGWRWSEELELYLGVKHEQLRYFSASGDLIPTPIEAERQAQQRIKQIARRADQEAQRADQEAQRADQEAQRAEQEAQRAERLSERLRALDIEPG
ncbi:MAG: Uma2 family endonuclease [Leptolyngbya sp. SIO4C1]|nr:Uma2 family endonuclease [Leptolyngbya sp. SIO4C1]